MAVRPFLTVGLAALALAVALGLAAPFAEGTPLETHDLGQAHLVLAVFGALVPALAAGHLHGLAVLHKRKAPRTQANLAAWSWGAGSGLLALGLAFADGAARRPVLAFGLVALAEAAVLTMLLVLRILPRRGRSLVDTAKDPLTKGDDAAFTQARFAFYFLVPATVATVAAGPWWDWSGGWAPRTYLAGIHLLLAGHALVSCYSITHLWIPRLSTVPAIAAGAIKGELHSSLLGLLLLMVGFGAGSTGFTIAGGAALFLGAFTWMGVLGANLMRNKSKTQRVTPEFTYIPWVFTGVFWLVCGVLLGVFLNAVPDLFAERVAGLRFTHAHAVLVGGFAQVGLGLAMRLVPQHRGAAPLPFHEGKWGFYALNLGLALLVAGAIGGGFASPASSWGGLLALLGLAAAFMSLARHGRRPRSRA